MTKYLISRILRSLISVVIVVAVIMVMIYSLLDKRLIFADDGTRLKLKGNLQTVYDMRKWEEYGYLDYVNFDDYIEEKVLAGEIDKKDQRKAMKLDENAEGDGDLAAQWVAQFIEDYEAKGYTIERLGGKRKSRTKFHSEWQPELYASKDVPVIKRLGSYFKSIFFLDNVNEIEDFEGERGLTFTWRDPAYGGKKFSPAVMGNGTVHKYLIYCNDQFPYIHQNLLTIRLGTSVSVEKGKDVWTSMTAAQGDLRYTNVTYPTGYQEKSADNLHSATYVPMTEEQKALLGDNLFYQTRFTDFYTAIETNKSGSSRMGYSFLIGIISVFMAYLLAVPMGIAMALKKDKFIDKLGTFYIVFITAVPSLAYIFMFRAIGEKLGLPSTFDMLKPTRLMYVLPIVSLALPSVANLMKWLRRYMIDQMNADYVKFARSGGLSEGEIFRKHILKNAIIPIAHGVPASILGAMTGAIITERVYLVPGVGNVLTEAINKYDNAVIVGVALFYAILTVTSVILGDVLMSMLDPRISFTAKER